MKLHKKSSLHQNNNDSNWGGQLQAVLRLYISVALQQKTGNFKVAIPNRLMQWSTLTEECAANAIQRKVRSQTTVWLGGSGALLLSDDGVLEILQGSWEG